MDGNESEDESVTVKPDFDSFDPRSLLSLLSQMQANLSKNSKILTMLVDKRRQSKRPLALMMKASHLNLMKEGVTIEPNVASMKANDYASENAQGSVAQAAHFSTTNVAASNAVNPVTFNAAETAILLDTGHKPLIMPSEDDAICLCGGQDLNELDSELQNEELLTSIDITDNLLTSREKKTSPDYKSIITQLIDSVALLGHVEETFFDQALARILSRLALAL